MNKTAIFGHQNPDSDSVISAITYSNLKNILGYHTEPRIIGNINNETKYILDYFNTPVPRYLASVKLKIKNIKYEINHVVNKNDSIFECLKYMDKLSLSTVAVKNDLNEFVGMISMKEIAKKQFFKNCKTLNSTISDICSVIEGKVINKVSDTIKGNIIVASYNSDTFKEKIEISSNDILIVSDRHDLHKYAIENGAKLIIVTNDAEVLPENISLAKEKNVNIVRTSLDTFMTGKTIELANSIEEIVIKDNLVTGIDEELLENFLKRARKTRFSRFAIVSEFGEYKGTLSLSHLNNTDPRKVILVDHNEKEQSVEGLSEARITEIIDHHKVGNIGTTYPIIFRNEPVGSTCTLIYYLYLENKVKIDKTTAGLLLSGIISDTLMLKSPTTSGKDESAIKALEKIAEIDSKEFAKHIFEAGSSIKDKTINDIVYHDFKNFNVLDKFIGIGQIFVTDISEIKDKKIEIKEFIMNESNNNGYALFALFVTDIINTQSYIISNDDDFFETTFNVNMDSFEPVKELVSRKQQIVPIITEEINKELI